LSTAAVKLLDEFLIAVAAIGGCGSAGGCDPSAHSEESNSGIVWIYNTVCTSYTWSLLTWCTRRGRTCARPGHTDALPPRLPDTLQDNQHTWWLGSK
jgi:hypothetical protein